MATSICTSAGIWLGRGNRTSSADRPDARCAPTVTPGSSRRYQGCCSATTATGHSPMSRRRAVSRRIRGRRSGSHSRFRPRRMDRPLRRQRLHAAGPVPEPGAAAFAESPFELGSRTTKRGRSLPAWAPTPRLRRRWMAGRHRDRPQPGALRVVPRRRARPLRVPRRTRPASDARRCRRLAGGQSSSTSTTTGVAISSSPRATCSIPCRARGRDSVICKRH